MLQREQAVAAGRAYHTMDDFALLAAAAAVTAERAYLAALGGGCQVPAGAYGRWDADGGTLRLTAMLATPDGSLYIRRSAALACEADADAARLGAELAATIIAEGGFEILKRMGRGGLR